MHVTSVQSKMNYTTYGGAFLETNISLDGPNAKFQQDLFQNFVQQKWNIYKNEWLQKIIRIIQTDTSLKVRVSTAIWKVHTQQVIPGHRVPGFILFCLPLSAKG